MDYNEMKIFNADLFDIISEIPDEYFDLVSVDPPYGKTALKWDVEFDANKTIKELIRVISPTGALLISGQNPMLADYISAGRQYFKYDLTWRKSRKNNYVNVKHRPLCETEKIAVFSKAGVSYTAPEKMYYNPFVAVKETRRKKQQKVKQKHLSTSGCKEGNEFISEGRCYPTDIIEIDSCPKNEFHPTQKPIDLYEYLILTYSKLGDKFFDPCFGSGNSLLAAKGLNRKAFGVEKDPEYFNNFKNRLQAA